MMKKNAGAALTLGFALFAMFFGAGNLILPPFIGLKAGENWPEAILGFFTTGIIAPFLGVLTVVLFGNRFTDLGRRTHPVVIWTLAFLIMLCIGPLVAIPRTGATTFEIGIKPLFPEMSSILFAVLFFTVVYFLSASKAKIVDIIGNVLTPLLLISLSLLVIRGTLFPSAQPQSEALPPLEAYLFSFYEGYQTLDVLASVIFAGIIISAAKQKGFTTPKSKFSITLQAGLISMFGLLFIYGGLIFLGAHSGVTGSENLSRTELLLHISGSILGTNGSYIISVAVAFACLTTAIALVSAMGSFLEELTRGHLKYKVGVLITCLISGILSVRSVDEIIEYAVVILGFVYPITFTLIIILLLFGKRVFSKKPYMWSLGVSGVVSLLGVLEYFGLFSTWTSKIRGVLPFSEYQLDWVLPALLTFLLVYLLDPASREKEALDAKEHD